MTRDQLIRDLFAYLMLNPCSCGEDDPVVLEFHHKDPKTKVAAISHMLNNFHLYSAKEILNEVLKCQTLCASCHARITAKDAGYWKYNALEGIQEIEFD